MTITEHARADALETWIADVLCARGVRPVHAEATARVLMAASLRGIDSHGIARLPAYVEQIERGLVELRGDARIARREGGTALIDARNILGAPAGELAAQVACELAGDHGVGWVGVRRSNHFGIAGYYARAIARAGFIAIASTNAAATVAPTRARSRFFGTNPLAFAIPSAAGEPLTLDISTSAVSGGKFEVALRAGETVPTGWGITADGEDTTDPAAVYREGGSLLPLGSFEEHSSHKGYGLALMVEILTALLVGGAHGPGVGALTSAQATRPADVSHFFVAVAPARFGDAADFADRVGALAAELRALEPRDPARPVLVPGDDEQELLTQRLARGVPLDDGTATALGVLADRTGVPLPGPAAAAAREVA